MAFSDDEKPVHMVECDYKGYGCNDELPEDCVFAEASGAADINYEIMCKLCSGIMTKVDQ